MIAVIIDGGGTRFSLSAKGHAGYNPGNDIVCSGVSTLCQSLLSWCMNAENVEITDSNAQSGDYYLSVKGDAKQAFQMALLGLKGIEIVYPKNISVNDENFLGFVDAI